MIRVIQRRLNPRYYASPGVYVIKTKFSYRVNAVESAIPVLKEWAERVQGALRDFGQFCCEGKVKALVVGNMVGYATDGRLSVFDEQTLKAIGPAIVTLFDVLCDRPVAVGSFMARFSIIVKVVKIHLKTEGLSVPFKELDTERRQKPKRIIRVTVPSPMLN